jgi:signal transduction histidine kinase
MGVMWGLAGCALYAPNALGAQMLVLFVVGGMCAGAASLSASHVRAFVAFAVPALVPTVVRLVADGDELHLAMAAMLSLFGVAMFTIARSSGRSLAEEARLRFVNVALAEDLARARETLEVRVRARGAELEAALADRGLAEEALILSERLASIGTLAGGIAHEVNNPLSFVLANQTFVREHLSALVEILQRDEELKDAVAVLREALEALDDAQTGAERVRRTIGDLKVLSRADPEPRKPIELAPVVERTIRLARSHCKGRARVETELGPVPRVVANEARLGQALLQLVVNGAQAFPNADADENVVKVVTRTDPDGRAIVEVEDRGVGIPPEVLAHVFEPFFTTKPQGKGAGLGLSICHGIVASLGGHINVDSTPGRGSTFRIVLPPARDDA